MIRRLIKDHSFFYKIYFYGYLRGIKGQRDIPFFNASTQLYFGAVPRSGNTYLNHLIRNIMPDLNSVHHLHSLAVVKIALQRKLPTFILIREPEECVSSAYLKRSVIQNNGQPADEIDLELLKQFLEDYISYYKYVDKERKKISIIHFEDLIKSPQKVLKDMADKLGYTLNDEDLNSQTQYFASTYKSNISKYGSSKPNEDKKREKRKIKEAIFHFDEYKEAKKLYERMIH